MILRYRVARLFGVCFNDTATTEIYTYGHTLSLHDALPISYLKHGENDHAVLHGPMNEVVLNSTRYLDDADVRAIASYLKALPANAQAAGPVASTAQLHDGEMGYTVHCGTCHLQTGLGDRGLGLTQIGHAQGGERGCEVV